jgi:hypothetical protein
VREHKQPESRSGACPDVTADECAESKQAGHEHADPIAQTPEHDASACEARHRDGVSKRGFGTSHPEVRLHCGERNGRRPHPDAANRAENYGNDEPPPCVARVHSMVRCRGYEHAA